ncbi:MAG: maleylpyruvate isomerase family mycothiol-dependent enzyme [Acidimicrobiales bacterium]|nr:maleylpyruvate isomerase family mycothiol-dependent enzyme [Acidimicrobiales bacterium]
MDSLAKDTLVDALAAEFDAIDELCSSLDPAHWDLATECPGWDVKANVVHIIGTESMLADRPNPEVEVAEAPHVKNPIGEFNEVWITAYRDTDPAEVLADLRDVTAVRLDALRSKTQADFDAESWTPAGQSTYGRFMRIRVFDCWMHEQDIRQAIGQPGHTDGLVVDVVMDEMSGALPFVFGKRGSAPDGSRITLELTGPSARTYHVAVAGRAKLVDALDGEPTATLRMPLLTFTRLAGGRRDAGEAIDAGEVELSGDLALARQLATNLDYVI